MDAQLGFLFALTFLINLIGSLAYSVRIAGVRTGRIALSFRCSTSAFAHHRSLPWLIGRALSPAGLAHLRDAIAMPTATNVVAEHRIQLPTAVGIMVTNTLATAVWTVGVFAALYAGYLAPELRSTASNLSGVINGVATILPFAIVDPFLAMLTDDVVAGRSTEPVFRRAVVWMLGSRLVGTVLAQVLLLPAAHLVATLARAI